MSDLPQDALASSPIERIDAQVAAIAGQVRDHPLVRVTGALSEVADQPPMIAISATTLLAGLAFRKPHLARAGGRMLASHLLATWVKGQIKDRIDRTRPNLLIEQDEYRMEPGDSKEGEHRSFPSGHTAGIVAVTRALAREYPVLAIPGAATSLVIAGIQIPRCKHYPSDLAAGAVIGWAAESVVNALSRRIAPDDAREGIPTAAK